MNNKFNLNDEIHIDYTDEISVNDLIFALDNSKKFELFEINNNETEQEKNILITIEKEKEIH